MCISGHGSLFLVICWFVYLDFSARLRFICCHSIRLNACTFIRALVSSLVTPILIVSVIRSLSYPIPSSSHPGRCFLSFKLHISLHIICTLLSLAPLSFDDDFQFHVTSAATLVISYSSCYITLFARLVVTLIRFGVYMCSITSVVRRGYEDSTAALYATGFKVLSILHPLGGCICFL